MLQKEPSALLKKVRRITDIFNDTVAAKNHQQQNIPINNKESFQQKNDVKGGNISAGNSNANNNSNSNSNSNNNTAQGGSGGIGGAGGNGGNSTNANGASAAMPDRRDPTPSQTLLWEASRGSCSIERMMNALEHGADPDFTDPNGRTPLIQAVRNYHEAAFSILINAGADIGKRDNAGRSAKDYAAGTPMAAPLDSAIEACIKSQMTFDTKASSPVARLKIGNKKDGRKQGA